MKILYNTYPTAFDCPGGGEVQLEKTYSSLKKSNLSVEKYNQWSPNIDQFDVVHFFSVYGGSFPFCDYVKKANKKLCISPVLWPSNPKQYPIEEISKILNLADIIFPNSDLEAKLLSKTFDIELSKFHTTYNGVDDLFFNNSDVTELEFRNKFNIHEPFILCVANIEHRKNQLNLARALRNFPLKVVLVGNVRVQEYYEDIQKESNGNFMYIGHIPHNSSLLRSAYKACELFVLPSHLETPGLAALEAAAMGCKLAITGEGSTKEYFGNFVHYLDPTDNAQMKKSIEDALSGNRSKDLPLHIQQNFSWKNTADQCLKGYKKVLEC